MIKTTSFEMVFIIGENMTYKIGPFKYLLNFNYEIPQHIVGHSDLNTLYEYSVLLNDSQFLDLQFPPISYNEGKLLMKIDHDKQCIYFWGTVTPKELFILLSSDVLYYILQHHTKGVIMHANAIIKDGQAMAFLGTSHSGKSTLSAFSLFHGYKLLSDDICPLFYDANRDEVYTFPIANGIKLRDDSSKYFNAIAGEKIFYPNVKTHYFDYGESAVVPIKKMYFVEKSEKLTLTQISGITKILVLLLGLYRSHEQSPTEIGYLAEISRRINIYKLSVPHSYESLYDLYSLIND